MEFKYRIGTIEDKEKLRKVGLASYGLFKDVLTAEHWGTMYTFLTAENSYIDLLSKSRCFVCELNGELIGMAYLVAKGNPTSVFEPEWSYIRMVGVVPEYGGNGIGKKLTEMCIAFAKESNEKTIALHTSEFMDTARAIYERAGFVQIKQIESKYGKKYWLYKLEL
jgi:ribosomal protein S18 acetylase RimI-like enzyme